MAKYLETIDNEDFTIVFKKPMKGLVMGIATDNDEESMRTIGGCSGEAGYVLGAFESVITGAINGCIKDGVPIEAVVHALQRGVNKADVKGLSAACMGIERV